MGSSFDEFVEEYIRQQIRLDIAALLLWHDLAPGEVLKEDIGYTDEEIEEAKNRDINFFISSVQIPKLHHLENVNISLDYSSPHLVITGKTGSGKTLLLSALAGFLSCVKNPATHETDGLDKGMTVGLINAVSNIKKYRDPNFIMTCYPASRRAVMTEPRFPMKPVLTRDSSIRTVISDQFLIFLADLKIQEALARNEKRNEDAEQISLWFKDFESKLRKIFGDEKLELNFNYREYSFKICTEGRAFKFNEMSDGYSAILAVVADLILKMQKPEGLSREYVNKGIVLIDELEAHLDLDLQRTILPLLTEFFPDIQFIVTTQSPMVIDSMRRITEFDITKAKKGS